MKPEGGPVLEARFSGSLLGGMIGDVIGAAVEAESPGYIRKTFRNLDDILALDTVPELFGGDWKVGQFTDDTQMTLSVAEWLAEEKPPGGKNLLERFCRVYEPWRHYGPGARLILESFPNAKERWMDLATAMFPSGSYGNGSAMRAGPVGLFLHNDLPGILDVAELSSSVTHSHYLAIQGATLQATAVAIATRGVVDPNQFLRLLSMILVQFADLDHDVSVYRTALGVIVQGIEKGVSPSRIVGILGNGIKAQEAVPMAIYCFLANPASFEKAVESAIFLGGDTDTIASMTGAIAGAALGENQIPDRWLKKIREPVYGTDRVRQIALRLCERGRLCGFRRHK